MNHAHSEAPDGYNLSDTRYTFTIDADHLAIQVNGGAIENEPGIILPDTGVDGDKHIIMLGIIIVMMCAVGTTLVMRRA